MVNMNTDDRFQVALHRLDTEIAETQARLDDLLLKRRGAEAFLSYMGSEAENRTVAPKTDGASVGSSTPAPSRSSAAPTSGPAATVLAVLDEFGGEPFTLEQLYGAVAQSGETYDQDRIRTGLHYLHRKHLVEKQRRGVWRANTDAEAPGATGASDGDRSNGDRSLHQEGGVPHDGIVSPGGRDNDSVEPDVDHDHRDGASVRR